MDEPVLRPIIPYPYPGLNQMLLGMNEGDVTYHVAGTGVGKTSFIAEYQYELNKAGIKFGVMRFEDARAKTQIDLMSIHVNKRLHLEDPGRKEKRRLHSEVFQGRNMEMFDPETAEWGKEAILSYIRYMSKALDCRVIFIDPLSFIIAGMGVRDERKAIDELAVELAKLAKETSVNLQITHHLSRPEGKAHEEGGQVSLKHIRGSGAIAMFATGIVGYERNQQGERPDLTRSRVLKARMGGSTGIADVLKFNEITGRTLPTNEPYDDSSPSEFGEVEQEY